MYGGGVGGVCVSRRNSMYSFRPAPEAGRKEMHIPDRVARCLQLKNAKLKTKFWTLLFKFL